MLKTLLVISLLYGCLEGDGGESAVVEGNLGEGGDGSLERKKRESESAVVERRWRAGLGDGGDGSLERAKRESEGSVMDQRGSRCTLPLFPCVRYSHKCCNGGSCRWKSKQDQVL